MTVDITIEKKVFNEIYYPYLNDQTRYLIFYGSAGSGKSVFVAQKVIYDILHGVNYLCVRKVKATIRHSIFAELKKVISSWGLNEIFKINETDFSITCKNGYRAICIGLDDPEKIKSITVEKGVITHIWLEEATEVNKKDILQLNLRLRGRSKKKKQMIMSFNPITIKSIIKKMFFDTNRDDTKILKTTYNDNRFLEKEDKEDIERLKDIDNYYWSVYGLGEWGVLGNTVYTNWEVKPLDEMRKHFVSFYNGLDFGYNKPSAVLHTAYHNDDIYILDEIYENKLTLEQLAQKTIELIGREYVVCDSAEPRSIEFMKGKGIKALSARKGKDSVLNGIMWLKGKRIFVNESCINTINELSLYKWREDKDGVALDQPVDENNHALDALRYAYEDMMKDKGKGLPDNEAGVYEIEREIVY